MSANDKIKDLNEKISIQEQKHWNEVNKIFECPGSSTLSCDKDSNNNDLTILNPCRSDPRCFCDLSNENKGLQEIDVKNLIENKNFKCKNGDQPICVGFSNIGTDKSGYRESYNCFNDKNNNSCLDSNKSCILQYVNSMKELENKGKTIYKYSIPKLNNEYGKGLQFQCNNGLFWKGPTGTELKGNKRIRTAIIPSCSGWKCDLTNFLNPSKYKGTNDSRKTIFDKVEVLDGNYDSEAIKEDGPFRSEPSRKLRFPKFIEENSSRNKIIPNNFFREKKY